MSKDMPQVIHAMEHNNKNLNQRRFTTFYDTRSYEQKLREQKQNWIEQFAIKNGF